MKLFGDGSKARARAKAKAEKAKAKAAGKVGKAQAKTDRAVGKVAARQEGRTIRIGAGGGSNFADSVKAAGGAIGEAGAGIADAVGSFYGGALGDSNAPYDGDPADPGGATDSADVPVTSRPWFLPAVGAGVLAIGAYALKGRK